jgi:hypothetical protein
MVIDAATRQQVVDTLVADLERYYVFPDKAKQYAAMLNAKQQQGAYDAVSSAEGFARRLTGDLQAVSHDRRKARTPNLRRRKRPSSWASAAGSTSASRRWAGCLSTSATSTCAPSCRRIR